MGTVNVYLNFPGNTEEAFLFYKSVFGGEFYGQGIMRFKDVPPSGDSHSMPDAVMNNVMHVGLPLLNGFMLMGSDAPKEMGFNVTMGNNIYINLQPDTREETRKLFKALSEGGKIEQELQEMFWGDYYGSCEDKFGVRWMFNCADKKE
jgi:PhnB protein